MPDTSMRYCGSISCNIQDRTPTNCSYVRMPVNIIEIYCFYNFIK